MRHGQDKGVFLQICRNFLYWKSHVLNIVYVTLNSFDVQGLTGVRYKAIVL